MHVSFKFKPESEGFSCAKEESAVCAYFRGQMPFFPCFAVIQFVFIRTIKLEKLQVVA